MPLCTVTVTLGDTSAIDVLLDTLGLRGNGLVVLTPRLDVARRFVPGHMVGMSLQTTAKSLTKPVHSFNASMLQRYIMQQPQPYQSTPGRPSQKPPLISTCKNTSSDQT
jgi:hypothetical protein